MTNDPNAAKVPKRVFCTSRLFTAMLLIVLASAALPMILLRDLPREPES